MRHGGLTRERRAGSIAVLPLILAVPGAVTADITERDRVQDFHGIGSGANLGRECWIDVESGIAGCAVVRDVDIRRIGWSVRRLHHMHADGMQARPELLDADE